MRKTFAIIILCCIGYFLGGWFSVELGWIQQESYFSYAGIVGALASVVGLVSLTRPPISSTDLLDLDLDSLKSITETAEELRELEREKTRTKDELGNLDIKRREMELLVQKGSLSLFLKEKLAHHENRILERVQADKELKEDVAKVQEISEKLSALNEEIDSDPNVSQLNEIVAAANRRESTLDELIVGLPPFIRWYIALGRVSFNAFNNVIRTLTR